MKIIAHRGAKGLAAENTMAAVAAGLQYHADEIEVDVRVTHDFVAVLSHDAFVMNGTRQVKIADVSLDDLWALQPNIPTLAEVLELINLADYPAVAHLEIKSGEPVGPIVDTIRECLTSGSFSLDSILLASKSQRILRKLHRELPGLGTVVIESWSGVRARMRARQLGTKRISMRGSWLWGDVLKGMYRRGYRITPYTMNDPAKLQKWQKYLYGVVTDYPDRFKK